MHHSCLVIELYMPPDLHRRPCEEKSEVLKLLRAARKFTEVHKVLGVIARLLRPRLTIPARENKRQLALRPVIIEHFTVQSCEPRDLQKRLDSVHKWDTATDTGQQIRQQIPFGKS